MEAKHLFAVLAGILLIGLSNYGGAVSPPFSIRITPLLIPVIVGGVNYILYRKFFYVAAAYGFALLLFNDILVRKYAGGIHDDEGREWIFFHSFLAFRLVVVILVLFALIRTPEGESRTKSVVRQTLWVLALGGLTAILYLGMIAPI